MKVYYDLHMHSCLSPCGADDMTPYNLVNMAALAGLQVIAVADHNTTRNCAAAVEVGREAGVLVVPAMELTCREDVHVLCLFPDLDAAEACRLAVYEKLPQRKNRPKAFGNQFIMDAQDNVVAEEPQLLAFAADIGVYQAAEFIAGFGGFAIPAHIDRASFSLIAAMGLVDPAMGFTVYETTPACDVPALWAQHHITGGHIQNSDAHDLIAIPDACRTLDVERMSPGGVIEAVKKLGVCP
jgi:hypothetical protein